MTLPAPSASTAIASTTGNQGSTVANAFELSATFTVAERDDEGQLVLTEQTHEAHANCGEELALPDLPGNASVSVAVTALQGPEAVVAGVATCSARTLPGTTVTAVHLLEPVGDRNTRVDTTIDFGGPVGAVLGRFLADITRRYLAAEADGLREACARDA